MATPLSPPPDAEDKLRGIRSITDAALSYLGDDEFLTELLSRVKESLDADTAAVLLLDRSARQLIATAASGLEEEVRQGVRLPVGQGFAGRIAAEARPIILDHVDHSNVLNPILPVLRRYFSEVRPAATMLMCGLADPRMKIEIEVYARRANYHI